MTDNEIKIKTGTEAEAYSLLANFRKRRIEIQKEMIEMDSKLGLGPGSESAKKHTFFRDRPKR